MIEKVKKYGLGVAILCLVIISGVLIYQKLHVERLADNLVQGSGRIDGDLINLNAKYAGRIEALSVHEGQDVAINETIATLFSHEYLAQKEQIEAQLRGKQQELNAKITEFEIAKKTIPEILAKAKANIAIKQHQREELDKSIASQKSVVAQDKRDLERMTNLYNTQLIEKRLLETATLKRDTSNDFLAGMIQKREQLTLGIEIANSDQIEASANQEKISALQSGIEALGSSLQALEASKAQIEAVLNEMTLRSPINGTVIEKIANIGEVVGSGSSIATLIDPHSLYLKIFVDTKQNGKIKVGDKAVIFLDSYPNKAIEAQVVRIEQKAEFTPKEVSVPSDRIQRVFAVHVKPLLPNRSLKMGIPAVGVVSMDGNGLPTSLKNVPE